MDNNPSSHTNRPERLGAGGTFSAELQAARYYRGYRKLAIQLGVVFLAILGFSIVVDLFAIERYLSGFVAAIRVAGEMMPPDFQDWRDWDEPLLDTLAMSVVGTALAVAMSIVLALLAARNTTPHPVVYYVARSILNLARAIPELIMGVFFVVMVGFGALPGVLALAFHSIGMVGKFFAESIEHVKSEPIEAARACGASRLQVITHGILPQVLPQMADVTIYRWEYNFRASTVLGMIGAGGIGFELYASLRILEYQEVSALLIVILGMVFIVDGISSAIRKKFQ